ncbi:MAG: hypothetical protein RLZZ129_1205 [Verrucomicrobiota bacterium]
MKIILDENVPLPLRQFLPGHSVTAVQLEGWSGISNGRLIALVEGRYDLLILADKNLRYQQNLTPRTIALVELPTNRWPLLKKLKAKIVSAVERESHRAATPSSNPDASPRPHAVA